MWSLSVISVIFIVSKEQDEFDVFGSAPLFESHQLRATWCILFNEHETQDDTTADRKVYQKQLQSMHVNKTP